MNTVDGIKAIVDKAFTPEYEAKTNEAANALNEALKETDTTKRIEGYKKALAGYSSYLSTRKFDDDKKKAIIQ